MNIENRILKIAAQASEHRVGVMVKVLDVFHGENLGLKLLKCRFFFSP